MTGNLFVQEPPRDAMESKVKSVVRDTASAVFLVFGLICAGAASADSNELQQFLDGLDTFQADFEQVLLDETGRATEHARGTLVLARGGRFRWDYQEPYPQLIVADGQHVWTYDSELAQVTVKELDEAVGDTPTLILTGGSSLEERFLMRDVTKRAGLEWIALTPKNSDVSFSEIRVGLKGGVLRRMELLDSFGQTTKMYFHNIVRNAPVHAEVFSFTPPAGADVIGDRPRND